jgi:GT2 family glycosyltransferase
LSASFACVVLTRGGRPAELRRALDSLRAQRGVELDVVVVGNGWEPDGLPDGVRSVWLRENRGIPAGRNAGVPEARGDLVLFLDDDAWLGSDDVLARVGAAFAADPALGLVQLRVSDPEAGWTPSQWVGRLRVGDPARSSDVTAVWEGAVVLPRRAFEAAGGWPEEFWYGHEGVDLAWRVLDRGYRVRYAGDVVVHHRAFAAATRHSYSHYLGARNRVFLARRNLPLPFALVYPATWFAITLARGRSRRVAQALLRGYRDGLRQPCGPRRPLRWRTLWRMTLAGRPPVV